MHNALARSLLSTRRLQAYRALAAGLLVLGLGMGTTSTPAADLPAPSEKDSRASRQPKQATLKARVVPAEAKTGDTVTLQVTANAVPGWHIYKYAKDQGPNGPAYTELELFDNGGLKPIGDWTPSRPPTQVKEEAFKNLPFVEYYENEVTWSLKLEVPSGIEPGKKNLRVQAYYQLCSSGESGRCTIPGRWTLPAAVLTVLPGKGASAPAPAASGPSAATPEPAPAPAPAALTSPPAPSAPVVPAPTASSSPAPAATASAPQAAAPENEVQKSIEQGLIPFLLLAVTGGLIALIMPCVWPMVPITVNFFVKEGQKNRGRTVKLAVTYCLAIIGIFTLVGVLFSALFGAASLQRLANAAWLNLLVAGLFLAFGLSLLGVFEFRLPNFVLNASARGESRGGVIGVIFMALTLTITSFTCTFPVVGGLLVMAAGGQYFYPVLGLATFAAVVALPFFLLALAPGLIQRMPRGGDWMNAVKVVGGLVEIGAAFKFINTAECAYVVPADAWFDAQVVLALWIALAMVCGVYLLGLFRTSHDHDAVHVGPGRILIGSLFLFLALYLSPALFGRPPQSMIWNRLVVPILPADVGELNQPLLAESGGGSCTEVRATSTDPKVAVRQEKNCHGVLWGLSYEAALEQARAENKPVLIDFTGINCANCRHMEQNVMTKPEVTRLLSRFVTVQLYTDFVPIRTITRHARQSLAEVNQDLLGKLTSEATNPYYATVSADGTLLEVQNGATGVGNFVRFLNRALEKYSTVNKVARADVSGG